MWQVTHELIQLIDWPMNEVICYNAIRCLDPTVYRTMCALLSLIRIDSVNPRKEQEVLVCTHPLRTQPVSASIHIFSFWAVTV